MIRRTFFQLLAGFSIPRPRWHTEHSPEAAGLVPKPVQFHPPNGLHDPEWLTAWLRLPRFPVLCDDLPRIAEPHERDLAARILRGIRSGAPLDFHYLGGSEPGKSRQVLPVLIFTTSLDSSPSDSEGPKKPLYLLAWCLVRNAPRTFRFDRIQIDPIPRGRLGTPETA